MNDYYKILGVPRAATTNQIRMAVVAKRRAASEDLAAALLDAEQMLLNPSARARYDKNLAESRHLPPSLATPSSLPSTQKPSDRSPVEQGRWCPTCRTTFRNSTIYCPTCGGATGDPLSSTENVRGPNPTNSHLEDHPKPVSTWAKTLVRFEATFLGRTFQGTVIQAESYERKLSTNILLVVAAIAVVILFLYIARYAIIYVCGVFLAFVIVALFVKLNFWKTMPLAVIVFGPVKLLFGLMKLPASGAKTDRMERVTNIRLRQVDGSELQVRIEGELATGSISPGDDVEVTGRLNAGTVLFSRGYNRRTNSKIRKALFA